MKNTPNPDKDSSSEIIISKENLRPAIANTLKYIEQNLDRVSQHNKNKDYVSSITFSTLVIEELGRYQVYLDALKKDNSITRKTMTKLNNHDYKNLALAKYLFNNPEDKFLQLVNRNKFEAWLNQLKPIRPKWMNRFIAIRKLALYPHWWSGKFPQTISLEDLIANKDIMGITMALSVLSKSWLNKIQSNYKISKSTAPLLDEYGALVQTPSESNYIHNVDTMNYVLERVLTVSDSIIKHKYNANSEKALRELKVRKRTTDSR